MKMSSHMQGSPDKNCAQGNWSYLCARARPHYHFLRVQQSFDIRMELRWTLTAVQRHMSVCFGARALLVSTSKIYRFSSTLFKAICDMQDQACLWKEPFSICVTKHSNLLAFSFLRLWGMWQSNALHHWCARTHICRCEPTDAICVTHSTTSPHHASPCV